MSPMRSRNDVLTVVGPGDSAEDVKWLDEKLKDFFAKN